MSDRSVVRFVRVMVVTGGVFAILGSVIFLASGRAGSWWSSFMAFATMFAVFFAVFVWLATPRQPRNAVLLTMAVSALLGGIGIVGESAAAIIIDDPVTFATIPTLVPANLPSSAARILMVSEPTTNAAFFALMTFGVLLFPDGKLPSPRWRWVGWLAAIGIFVATVGLVWGLRPGNGAIADQGFLVNVGFGVTVPAMLLSAVALIVRFRRSSGETRDQIKWVVWGASIMVPALVAAISFGNTEYVGLVLAPLMVAGAVFLTSYGIAVGKYRLFDVDVVISRTVVFAGLAGFITVVYAGLVGGVGLVLGSGTDASLPLSVAATAVVAVAFQPMRLRMRRWADRLVYGERATPYEVLSRFAARMRDAVATEDVIPQMAQLLTQGTGATDATVWMRRDGELQPVAAWPDREIVPGAVPASDGELSIPGVDHVAPIEHDGELLGAVSVTMPRGGALTATEQRLVDDVASQAGLVMRNARLTADLFDTIAQLRSSRQRLVAAQDEERRRLERDIHDGAQQQLIAVKIKTTAAQQLAARGDADRAAELLQQVVADTSDAVDSLRALAHGIYPPLLEAEGLHAALVARTAKAPLPVFVTAHGLGRYSPEVEAAVYFCVLESVQNAVKYAEASQITVTLETEDDALTFQVTDDGNGFDAAAHSTGRGLTNITDRLDALGGELHIQSAPQQGTTITATLHSPLSAPEASRRGPAID